jgi:hypothetical protein
VQAVKDRHDFPKLREFARGYLHQDLLPEYGDPKSAAMAYVADLTAEDRAELAREIERFEQHISPSEISAVNKKLAALGASWTFKNTEEFAPVWNILRESNSKS